MKAMQSDIVGNGNAVGQSCASGQNQWSLTLLIRLSAFCAIWLALLFFSPSAAAAYFTRVAGPMNWNANGSWSTVACGGASAGAAFPTAADDVTICNGMTITVDAVAGRAANSVTIAGGANASTLTFAAGSSLAVTNNVVIGAPTAAVNKQITVLTGTLTVGTTVTATAGNTNGSFSQLTATSGSITIGGNVTLTGGTTATRDALLSVGSGIITINGGLIINATVAASSSATITAAGGRITVNGAAGVTNGDTVSVGVGTFSVTNAAATFTTTNAAIVSSTTVTSGTLAIAGNASVTGGATNPSGATMSVTTGILTVGGTLGITAGSNTNTSATTSVTTGRITVTGNTTLTGGAAAGRNALLTATGIPAVVGNGINLNGTLDIVTTAAGTVASAAVSMTAAGAINVVGTVNNGGTVTIGTGTFSVTNVASTYNNNSAVVVALTTISTGTLTVAGNLTNGTSETITLTGAGNINVAGNWSNSGTFTYSTSTVTFNGTTAQTLGGTAATTFYNLTINKTAGDVTITSASAALSPTVNNILTFTLLTSGKVITTIGTNDIGLGAAGTAGTVANASATLYVVGDVQKYFPINAGTSTFQFPIGDSTKYQPVTVALTGVTTAGLLDAYVGSGDHPDTIANLSRIDQTNSANHYWILTPGTLAGGTYTATFQFCVTTTCVVPAERDATTTTANFIVARKYPVITGSWIRPAVSTITANTILTTGGSTSAQGFGAFAVGELLPANVYKGVNQLIDLREIY